MQNLWLDKNIKEAIDEPRFHHQLLPMHILAEEAVSKEVSGYLEKVGHKIVPWTARKSIIQGIAVKDGIITANYDARKAGQVSGF